MKPIPPNAAFAVDNIVDARVRAALAEARRIRDTWQAALEAAHATACEAARAACAAELRAQLSALHIHVEQTAAALAKQADTHARQLAERLVGAAFEADGTTGTDWIAALLTQGHWTHARVPHPIDTPDGVTIEIDPSLRPGEIILTGPGGVVDARFRARLARLGDP